MFSPLARVRASLTRGISRALQDLGEIPVANSVDDDREVQLVLTNRFAEKMEEEISAATSLYVETKEVCF